MTKEQLKELGLTEEQITAVLDDLGKNFVSKSQFNEKNDEVKSLKNEVETHRNELNALKKQNKDNAELVEQIDALKEAAKTRDTEYKTQLHKLQVDRAVDIALLSAKAKNTKAVTALLNLDNAELVDGQVKGLAEQLEALKKSDAYLFDVAVKGVPAGNATTPGETPAVTKEQFKKMSYSERTKLFTENNELYTQLAQED